MSTEKQSERPEGVDRYWNNNWGEDWKSYSIENCFFGTIYEYYNICQYIKKTLSFKKIDKLLS